MNGNEEKAASASWKTMILAMTKTVIHLVLVNAYFFYVSQLRVAVAFSALAHEEFQPHY